MTDLGLMKYFLGLEVIQGKDGIFVSQERYAEEVLKKFKMTSCNPVSTLWNLAQNFLSIQMEIELMRANTEV